MFLYREGMDLGVAFQDPPGCQASCGGEAKDSAVLPSRDADLLEPPSGAGAGEPGRLPSLGSHRVGHN